MSGAAVAAIARKARKHITDHFTTAGATTPEHAIAFDPPTGGIEGRIFRRMTDYGAIHETKLGFFWLDEQRLSGFKKESLARVLGILAIAGFAAAAGIAFAG